MIPALVNLAVIVLAMRWLGKEAYGQYSLIFYFLMLVCTFTLGWIQQSVLRYLSAYSDDLKMTVIRFKVLTFLSSFAGTLVVIIPGIIYFNLHLTETLLLAAVLILYNNLFLELTIEQTLFRPLRYAVKEGVYNIVMLLTFIVLFMVFHVNHYLILFVAMLVGLVIVPFLPKHPETKNNLSFHWSAEYFDKGFAAKMWSYGILLSVWLSISYLFNIANRFFIKEYAGYEQVGVFSSVYDIIFKISGFVCMPVLLAYHPKITSLWNQGNRNAALKEIRMALLIEVVVFIAVVAVFMPGRALLYDKVLHLNESGLGWMSLLLIVSAFLWQAAMLVHKTLELLLKLKQMILAILVALMINIAGNFLLIPVYGYKAAAITTFAGIVSYITIVAFVSRYYFNREVQHG